MGILAYYLIVFAMAMGTGYFLKVILLSVFFGEILILSGTSLITGVIILRFRAII